MKMLQVKEESSVKLFHVEVSEDELDVYENCLRYIYTHFRPRKINDICGAEDEELMAMIEQLSELLETFTDLPRGDMGEAGIKAHADYLATTS
ncbi:hypothetical protein QUF64_13695 [Anaerolineales bacterium HSG6]|nr:hypothetical protein [Anaerolineales bacterium HSG6]